MSDSLMNVPQRQQSLISTMATRYSIEPNNFLKTLQETVFKKATNEQLMMLCMVANEYKLNPFLREIYAFPAKEGISAIVGIDGWLKIINSQPNYDGMELEMASDGKSCTCKIYRKDRDRPTSITEYLDECKRETDPWRKCPKRMLRHRAIIQCARIAFGITGINDDNDADIFLKNSQVIDAVPSPAEPSVTALNAKPAPIAINVQRQIRSKAKAIKEQTPEPETVLMEPAPVAESAQPVEQPVPKPSISPEKRAEIEKWIQDGCETKEDYDIAVNSLVNNGMIETVQVQEAWEIVIQVAAKNGIKM